MHMEWKSITRRLLTAAAALLLLPAGHEALAASLGNANLTVTASVTSYVSIAFSGTNISSGTTGNSSDSYTGAATLSFGSFNYGSSTSSTGATVSNVSSLGTCTSGCIEVSQPVTLTVTAYDLNSTGYTVSASLGTADSTNGWALGTTSQTLTNGTGTTIAGPGQGGSFAYNTAEPLTVYLAVPQANGSSAPTSISNTIDMVLTAQ
jgi:hypothetical protein